MGRRDRVGVNPGVVPRDDAGTAGSGGRRVRRALWLALVPVMAPVAAQAQEAALSFDAANRRLATTSPAVSAAGHAEAAAREAGRDPDRIGMEGRVNFQGDHDRVTADIDAWAAAGATHLSVNTMGAGLRTVDEHLAVLEAIAVRAGLQLEAHQGP